MRARQVTQLRRSRMRQRARIRENDLAPLRIIGATTVLFFGSAIFIAVIVFAALAWPILDYAKGVPSPTEAAGAMSAGGAKIYDRNGNLLYQFVAPTDGLREPVPLASISPWLIKATIAVEDPTFYENPGINVRGVARAAYENFSPWGGEILEGSGGSSITQQLAKNTYIPFEERADRNLDRKAREAAIALELTERYSKDQILEWYLNSISYGGVYVGIQAASEGYFGKSASELTLGEATLLAGLPQSPARYDPVRHLDAALARRREVLRLMVKHGVVANAQALRAEAQPVVIRQQRFELRAPHFVLGPVADELKQRFGEDALYREGLIVKTTLDLRLNDLAGQVLEEHIAKNEANTNSRNGALMAVDPHNGQVLAYVGSRDYYDDAIQGRNDNITALNSPGSTLKPFTYLTAFTKGWGTGTGIADVPFTYHDIGSDSDFKPVNPGKHYMGVATAAKALGNSSNVSALRAILFAGVDSTVDTLRSVGYTTFRDRSQFGPALTLGGTDIRLKESVIGYSVLANGGIMRGEQSLTPRPDGERKIDPVVLLEVTDAAGRIRYRSERPVEQRVLPEGAAALVTSILSDGENTCVTWSCGALKLTNGMPAAVKTGASEPFVDDSKDTADTWTLGYTTELVAGVWAGNSNNEPVHNLYSTTIAWHVWNDFMIGAHEILGLEPKPFELPSSVEERVVCWPSGNIASSACPSNRRYKSLFMKDVKVPTDTWWHRTADGRLVLSTPKGFRAAPSENLVSGSAGTADGASTTSSGANAGTTQAGGETLVSNTPGAAARSMPGAAARSTPGAAAPDASRANVISSQPDIAALSSPFNGSVVSGAIAVVGTARSANMLGYYLDAVGSGGSVSLAVGVSSQTGQLAVWDTRSVPNGVYTVRLVVQDGARGTLIDTARITVQN